MYPDKQSHSAVYIVKEPMELLPFIMKMLAGVSRTRAKAILSGGGVRVDHSRETRHDFPLRRGQHVEICTRKKGVELKNRFVRLVYEDRHLVVIEKNVGILSMATSHHAFCVKTVLDNYFHQAHQKCTAHVVHRLDRDTSGLMIYAKTLSAEQTLEHNWHEIVTDRRYVALVAGRLEQEEGCVESWLKDNKAYFTYSSPVDNGGKYAVTRYRLLRATDDFSLVELRLETGRKNQIRVHMQDLGHPVCGDVKYGNGVNPLGRLALHAYRLHFHHPVTGELLRFETPVPPQFLRVFSR